jgi:hypothetical protein
MTSAPSDFPSSLRADEVLCASVPRSSRCTCHGQQLVIFLVIQHVTVAKQLSYGRSNCWNVQPSWLQLDWRIGQLEKAQRRLRQGRKAPRWETRRLQMLSLHSKYRPRVRDSAIIPAKNAATFTSV